MMKERSTMIERKIYAKRVLDYDIGHLVKSPCKGCESRHRFPKCMNNCDDLDRIQTVLARTISTSRAPAPWELHRLLLDRQD